MPEITIDKQEYRLMNQKQEVPDFLKENGFDLTATKEIKKTEEFGKITFKQESK